MPFPMKIQPIDCNTVDVPARFEPVKPVMKSRLKRLFERQFQNVLRNSAAEKTGLEELHFNKDSSNGLVEFEPSSLCLAKMVQNFIEDNNSSEKQLTSASGRTRCNCFNGNRTDSSEDELDAHGGFCDSSFSSSAEACELLKSLVPCTSTSERNLLADTARIVESKVCKRKDEFARKIVTEGLLALGYDASICKSRWEKSSSFPAGEYEYVDVVFQGDRLLIDIDFRSEFEIARSTKTYKSILQTLPYIFLGKGDRLQMIISIVSEAANQSLKKKGMHVPPWRKVEYVQAKWLSPYTRMSIAPIPKPNPDINRALIQSCELKQGQGGKNSVDYTESGEMVFSLSEKLTGEKEKATMVKEWEPPEVKPKSSRLGVRIVTGLASVIEDEP